MTTELKRVRIINEFMSVIELNDWKGKMKISKNKQKLKELKDIYKGVH